MDSRDSINDIMNDTNENVRINNDILREKISNQIAIISNDKKRISEKINPHNIYALKDLLDKVSAHYRDTDRIRKDIDQQELIDLNDTVEMETPV